MATTSEAPPTVRGGPHLTVSWRRPGTKTWHPFEDKFGRAILAAGASGQATFELEKIVRRSPRLNPEPRKWKSRRTSVRNEHEDVVVTLKTIDDGSPASNSGPAIRWGFSSTCTFDRLPYTARALAAMVAECEAAKKRQVASELLNFLTSEGRMYAFLSKIDLGCQPFQWYSRPHKLRTGILRVSRVVVNERALPGGALYERFLNTMEGHVADLGDALQALLSSASQTIAPLTFAFHGTPPTNIPSILENGMLPEKRVAGGDWFARLPFTSLGYCQKFDVGYGNNPEVPSFQLIIFLLLPIPAVEIRQAYPGVIVLSDPRYELPLCTVDVECDETAG